MNSFTAAEPMAVFVDTGIFVALHNGWDEFIQKQALMKQALKGEFGRIFTSDYVIDEASLLLLWELKGTI